ncbi:flagellar hook-length control protein FliK [Shewanella sp. 125m-7]
MMTNSVLAGSTPSSTRSTATGSSQLSNPITDNTCSSCTDPHDQHQADAMPFSMAFSLINAPVASQQNLVAGQRHSGTLPTMGASLAGTQLTGTPLNHPLSGTNPLPQTTSFATSSYGQQLQSQHTQATTNLSAEQMAVGQALALAEAPVAIKPITQPVNQPLDSQKTGQALTGYLSIDSVGQQQSQLNTVTAQTSFSPVTAMVKSDTMMAQNLFQGLHTPATITDAASVDIVDSVNQILASSSRSQASVAQWGPVSVSQTAPMLQQAHEMRSPLREQLKFQIDQQIKQAEIRLDPPELGKVELNVRLDGDRLHIQMHAANSSVRDALLMGLDRLRAELAMDHGGQIDVDISQGESQQKQASPMAEFAIAAATANGTELSYSSREQQADHVDLLA